MENKHCPECLAEWEAGQTCQEHFHQMLFWEAEMPWLGEVHHLMVLCYYLQHPSLYSPSGVQEAINLLIGFVEGGISTQQMRRKNRAHLSSTNRKENITTRPGAQGAYEQAVAWRRTAGDVVAGGSDGYIENVRQWARTVLEDLRHSGNIAR
jgi:hypothetical protein